MLGFLKRRTPDPAAAPAVERVRRLTEGERVYAIGDIHGRLDLFDTLMRDIERDDAARPPANLTIILLGDLIDRGPQSAEVVERVLQLRDAGVPIRVLMGNHEQMMLAALSNEPDGIGHFLRVGGRETFRSYGMTDDALGTLETAELAERARALVGPRHIAFLQNLESSIQIGDYLFVHAGIRPGRPLAEQTDSDLYWIRRVFLDSDAEHGALVVHGHTPMSEATIRPNRIGIDTGAYFSGQLTALGVEGEDRWILSTQGARGEQR